MIALFVGLIVVLVGVTITSNAAFSDRATAGAVVAIVGAVIFVAGVIDVVINLLFMVGV